MNKEEQYCQGRGEHGTDLASERGADEPPRLVNNLGPAALGGLRGPHHLVRRRDARRGGPEPRRIPRRRCTPPYRRHPDERALLPPRSHPRGG
jgi:hypothetical protein